MSQYRKSIDRKVTIVAGTGTNNTIDRLFQDRDELMLLLAIGRNRDGGIYFYDSGGDIIEDLGVLESVRQNLLKR